MREMWPTHQSAGSLGGPPLPIGSDAVFARDQFLLRQKHLSISAKYYVWDERGQAILFVERPAHFLRNLGAAACGVLAAVMVGSILGFLTSLMPNDELKTVGAIIAVLGAIVALFIVAVALSAKRHVNFYRDDSKRELVLRIFQDKKLMIIHATYTVADAAGAVLARLDKNYLYNIFRKRWYLSRIRRQPAVHGEGRFDHPVAPPACARAVLWLAARELYHRAT